MQNKMFYLFDRLMVSNHYDSVHDRFKCNMLTICYAMSSTIRTMAYACRANAEDACSPPSTQTQSTIETLNGRPAAYSRECMCTPAVCL